MKEKTKYYLACWLTFFVIAIISLSLGFLIGRKSTGIKEVVKYEKGETIKDTVNIPEPYEVIKPSDPIYILEKVDTAKIIEDWVLSRKYNVTLFDNDNGKLNIDASVQYNQLKDLQYTFTPIQKVITKQKERIFQPFVSGSYSTSNYVGVGGGFFYHNLGFEYQYQIDLRQNNVFFEPRGNAHLLGIKYKFR